MNLYTNIHIKMTGKIHIRVLTVLFLDYVIIVNFNFLFDCII